MASMAELMALERFDPLKQVASWEQYFSALTRDRAYSVVEEYQLQTSYAEPASVAEAMPPAEGDSTHCRHVVRVLRLHSPLVQLVEQLKEGLEAGGSPWVSGKTLEEAVRNAVEEAAYSFATPDASWLLVQDGDEYVLAPTDPKSVVVRMLHPLYGCVVPFKPRSFVRVRVEA